MEGRAGARMETSYKGGGGGEGERGLRAFLVAVLTGASSGSGSGRFGVSDVAMLCGAFLASAEAVTFLPRRDGLG